MSLVVVEDFSGLAVVEDLPDEMVVAVDSLVALVVVVDLSVEQISVVVDLVVEQISVVVVEHFSAAVTFGCWAAVGVVLSYHQAHSEDSSVRCSGCCTSRH